MSRFRTTPPDDEDPMDDLLLEQRHAIARGRMLRDLELTEEDVRIITSLLDDEYNAAYEYLRKPVEGTRATHVGSRALLRAYCESRGIPYETVVEHSLVF